MSEAFQNLKRYEWAPPGNANLTQEKGSPARPFLKWVGGKHDLAPIIASFFPCLEGFTYHEPCLGGGGMYFWLQEHNPPKNALLSDANHSLIRTYRTIVAWPGLVHDALEQLAKQHCEEFFYETRKGYNEELKTGDESEPVMSAARFIYLNKSCFNGLYRLSKKEKAFNVPWNRKIAPANFSWDNISAASQALGKATIYTADVLDPARWPEPRAPFKNFFYFDPPYIPLDATSSFTRYAGDFGDEEQVKLRAVLERLTKKNYQWATSNSDTPRTRELYRGLRMEVIPASRRINSKGNKRGPVNELLIMNYQLSGQP